MIRIALVLMICGVACKREQRSFEASAAAKSPMSLPPQGTLVAGGAPLVAGAELELSLPDYAETAQNISEGKMLYQRMNCVGCHHYGGGGIGPAFMDPTWRYGSSPLAIATSIIAGRKDGMPSYRGKLTGTPLRIEMRSGKNPFDETKRTGAASRPRAAPSAVPAWRSARSSAADSIAQRR